jgi:hypothetical protein
VQSKYFGLSKKGEQTRNRSVLVHVGKYMALKISVPSLQVLPKKRKENAALKLRKSL